MQFNSYLKCNILSFDSWQTYAHGVKINSIMNLLFFYFQTIEELDKYHEARLQEIEQIKDKSLGPFIAFVGNFEAEGSEALEDLPPIQEPLEGSLSDDNSIGAIQPLAGNDNGPGDESSEQNLQEVESVSSTAEIFIIINDLKFKIDSTRVADAVDYCFKVAAASNSDFPSECNHICQFIHSYV